MQSEYGACIFYAIVQPTPPRLVVLEPFAVLFVAAGWLAGMFSKVEVPLSRKNMNLQ